MFSRSAIILVILLLGGCSAMKFHATPSAIGPHQDAKLTWDTQGAKNVSISPEIGGVQPSGWVNVAPHTTQVYTLTAIGSKGKKVKKVKVRRK